MGGFNLYADFTAKKDIPIEKSKYGMLELQDANSVIREAAQRPDPKMLYKELWYEGEVSCLFADTNSGKSLLAVQIGTEIAKIEKVLYLDLELSDKQFQLRYSDEGVLYEFPLNFYRVSIDRMSIPESDFEESIMKDIETMRDKTGAKVLIIDNLTWLCTQSEKASDASVLMRRLLNLKFKYGLSMLCVAHTPKRNMCAPITQNDLAGSKRLINFFDSSFAIGVSAKDEALRYLKQIKCRYGSFTYDSGSVIVCHIEKINSFTSFVIDGYSNESEHLKQPSDKDTEELAAKVKELVSSGRSYRDVAQTLGISHSKVQRIIKK